MNKVILSGRTTNDVEVRYTAGDNPMAVAKFTLAVPRMGNKEENNADFVECTAFGKTAENMEKYVKKGSKIIVIGEWRTSSYKNKDGHTIKTNNCNVSTIEYCSVKNGSSNSGGDSFGLPPMPNADDIMNGNVTDLPFA